MLEYLTFVAFSSELKSRYEKKSKAERENDIERHRGSERVKDGQVKNE